MTAMRSLVEANELASLTQYLLEEIKRLARAGAEFGFMASNTPHIVFDSVRRQSPIPLISIVEATCQAAQGQGLKRLALFGTRFTMQGEFYPQVFSRAGIALVVPSTDEQAYIHDKYMNELVLGAFLPETRAGLLAIADRMRERDKRADSGRH
jgi:aspartate racemase